MNEISTKKLKAYLLLIFLGISVYGATLDVLLSSSNFRDGLDLYNYEKVYADSTNSGFNFFTDHTDITTADVGSYVTFDVSAYLPAGSTGAIIEVTHEGASTYRGFYFRHPDSTDDYYQTGFLPAHCHTYVIVAVNSSRCFEAKKEDTDIHYYLIGYTDSNVVLETNLPDHSLGVTLSWEDVDLSADVPAGATGVIVMSYTGVSAYEFGVRHPDSTDTFNDDTIGNRYALCGVNSSRMIESYIENVAVDMYLVGYTTDPVTFKTNWDDVSLGATGSYLDVDVTAETVADATGVLIYIEHAVGWEKGAIREDGSTNDLYDHTRGYVLSGTSGLVGLGTGEIFEGKIEDLAVDFFVIGYVEEAEAGTEVYPDHVEDSYLVTNATHTLLNNDTFAEIGAVGWIVWDFGEAVANVTRINWDLVYSQTGSNFRIEGSVDAVSWDVLVHTDPNKIGSPPSTNYFWSRYDSETHTRYRYFRFMPIYSVITNWYLDSFWLTIQPPAISYDDGTYVYPSVLQYSNFEPSYTRLRPYGTLGRNETATATIGVNDSSAVVNIDHDADNYLIVKFGDYYNITLAQVHARQSSSNMHFYLYMSTTGESGDWTRVGDWSGLQGAGWYGATINGTRIRYLMVNCTGVGTQYLEVEAFRIIGDIHTGEVEDEDEDEFDFGGIPQFIADLLGISVEAGGFLASLILMASFLLPIAVYDRKGIIALIVGVSVLGFCVLLTWLPTWIMLLTILLVAGIFAFNFSRWFGGR